MFVIRELLDGMGVNRNGTLALRNTPAGGFWGSGKTLGGAVMCAANNILEDADVYRCKFSDNPNNAEVLAQYMQYSGATLVIAWEVQEPDPIALYLQP